MQLEAEKSSSTLLSLIISWTVIIKEQTELKAESEFFFAGCVYLLQFKLIMKATL